MKAILHDVTRCTGCMQCVQACAEDNHLYADPRDARFDQGPLSDRRFTTVEKTTDGHAVRRQCMHCLEPSCASACLVGALTKTDGGAVVYDASKCIGCRYCMISCPYHAIHYEWQKTLPFIKKCDLCYDRRGGPACVAACPHEATHYGERSDLIAMAHDWIAADPKRYAQKVWGEEEAGGTCVLYVSHPTDVHLDALFPTAMGTQSIPDLTAPVVQATPWLALGVASFLVGTSWVINRRNRLAEERARAEATKGDDGEHA